jgi:biopolymer transport protein ExbB
MPTNITQIFNDGGPVMFPLLILSILALAAIFERGYFWFTLLRNEGRVLEQIMAAARQDLEEATEIAEVSCHTPIGQFLFAPLALERPDPDLFCLALESEADNQLSAMLKGEKLFESVISLAPLLGLLGTVIGLIISFSSLKIGEAAKNLSSGGLTQGLAQALIATATGLIIAIATLVFQRLFLALHARQVQLFRKAGNELELLYRIAWQQDQNRRVKSSAKSPN